MKNTRSKLITFFLLIGYLLAACNGTLPAGVEVKPGANGTAQVEFAGKVEAINGDQWTVNGQTFTVSAQTQVGAAFKVGDEVQVSATVGSTGAVEANEVRAFDAAQKAQMQTQAAVSPMVEATVTPQPSPTQSQTQTQTQPQPLTGSQNPEFVGTVEAINGNQWMIGGQVFIVTNTTQLQGTLNIGALVKVQVRVNADNSLTVLEMAPAMAGTTPGWNDGSSPSNAGGGLNSNSNSNNNNESSQGKDDQGSNDHNNNANDDHKEDDNSNGSEDGGSGNGESGSGNGNG